MNVIDVNETTSEFDILSHSEIYIDKRNIPNKQGIVSKEFISYKKDAINLGFAGMDALWIRFTLRNTQNKEITKTLEYDNQEVEDIFLYDGHNVIVEGMFHMRADRFSTNPIFELKLAAHEQRTYYIKAHSKISSLIGKLVIWEKNDFILNDQRHKLYLFIFFTIIVTLLLYNFMLYVFTQDKAYMYYVIYLFGVIVFQSIYLGIAQLYFFNNTISIEITKATFGYISILVIPIILFTREFLNTYKFEKIDLFLKAYLYISPVMILFSYDNIVFNLNILIIFIPLGFTIVFSGFYALTHGEKQARFYIAGWSFVIISLVFSVFKAIGLMDVTKYFYYINEVAFVFEALLFSIALAHRIKILTADKDEINQKLIDFQRGEQFRLRSLVNEKTNALQDSLTEKDVLYRELNHRVKNNLQMILSLVKLQRSRSASPETINALDITINRVNSISYLYERMNLNDRLQELDTLEYCEDIVDNLTLSCDKNVTISVHIKHNLHIDKLVYFGIIVNELITNALKYAFDDVGQIDIKLYKNGSHVHLLIRDNGKGFKENYKNSLGLEIVNTLVNKQLLGRIERTNDNGAKITIEWEEK